MSDKKAQAMYMYLNESCTQQHIANTLGISVRTIYNWIRQNSWDRLKQASLAAPVIIADNLCFQLLAMQQSIAEREPGKQFPTMQEAEITRKLVMCIDKLKRYPSLTQSMQVLEIFRQYVRAGNERDSWPIERWMGKFMESKAKGGFRPNDIEYNAENLSPFGMPVEEENIDDNSTTMPSEPGTEFFSDQPEILLDIIAQDAINQLPVSVSPVERSVSSVERSRQQSEVKPEAKHPEKGLNFGRHTSRKNKRSPQPQKQNSVLNYLEEDRPETHPQNTTSPAENQNITTTSDNSCTRQQSEIPACRYPPAGADG